MWGPEVMLEAIEGAIKGAKERGSDAIGMTIEVAENELIPLLKKLKMEEEKC